MTSNLRYCNIASLPEREASLERTVKSILPQVDFVKVILNGYTGLPKFLTGNPKITCVHTQNELGDASKFHGVDEYSGYVFTLDDDLVVSSNYADYLIEGVNKYGSIVSLHGKDMKPRPINSFYDDFLKIYPCLSTVKEDVQVDICGSGVMCFHTDFFSITPQDCPIPNMADIWVAVKAKAEELPLWVLKHESGFLTHTRHTWDIFRHFKPGQPDQVNLINKYL